MKLIPGSQASRKRACVL